MPKKKGDVQRYWNVHSIAKQLWCHQEALFKLKRNQPEIIGEISKLLELPEGGVTFPSLAVAIRDEAASAFDEALDDAIEYGRQLPTQMDVFKWRNNIILAMPDGLTSKLAYEFKSIAKEFWVQFQRPVARLQAHLYGYFFGRPTVQYDLWLRQERRLISEKEKTDRRFVEERLEIFENLVTKKVKPKPPASLKCSSCDFSLICKIRPGR